MHVLLLLMLTISLSGLLEIFYFLCTDVNADNVLYKLKKYKFDPASWEKLAVGLRVSSVVNKIGRENRESNAQLIALINHWVDKDKNKSWEMLVEAMEMSDHDIAADELARDKDVRVRPANQ